MSFKSLIIHSKTFHSIQTLQQYKCLLNVGLKINCILNVDYIIEKKTNASEIRKEDQTKVLSTSNTTARGADRRATWSNWSEWSPCRGVNRDCDPGRIHSRIRKCIGENGDVISSDICRVSDNEQQELEIRDCRCDPSADLSPYRVNLTNITDQSTSASQVEKPDRACNDCSGDEICLLQVKAAVPFCAKVKDPTDPRGCGGWCAGHKELCRYVGSQTYQCVDDSECLEDEWQCANGLCIPQTRRCE